MQNEDLSREVEDWLKLNKYCYFPDLVSYEKQIGPPLRLHFISILKLITNPTLAISEVFQFHQGQSLLKCDDFKKYLSQDDYKKYFDFDEDDVTKKIEFDQYGTSLRPSTWNCQHERGTTPLKNDKNELWIICRKCGKDLELLKK